MDSSKRSQELVGVVIPALNEEATIGPVIQAANAHPLVKEVVVVDDGSTDQTAVIAETCGAKVVSLTANLGKAEAMSRGVEQTSSPIIVFLDGDLINFTPRLLGRLIHEVRSGRFDMFADVQDYGRSWLNLLARWAPVLSGIRALRREVWYAVPERYKKRYQIEVALNFFARKAGYRLGWETARGLSQVIKERKRGWAWGLYQRVFMMRDVVLIILRLYLLLPLENLLYLRRRQV